MGYSDIRGMNSTQSPWYVMSSSYYAFCYSSIVRSKKKPEIDLLTSQFGKIQSGLVSPDNNRLLSGDNKSPQHCVVQSFIEQFYECRRKQWVGLHAYWGESKQGFDTTQLHPVSFFFHFISRSYDTLIQPMSVTNLFIFTPLRMLFIYL